MSETPNIDELKAHLSGLNALLSDPQPGLATWRLHYENRVTGLLTFWGAKAGAGFATPQDKGKDLLGVDVKLPSDPKDVPKPSCPKCGDEVPGFYCYLYRIEGPRGPCFSRRSAARMPDAALSSWCCRSASKPAKWRRQGKPAGRGCLRE